MNHVDKRQKAGFTIIELMLAMAFISVLLLGIAMTVIQISAIYNRGIALKEVNQVARDIASDVRTSIGNAQPLVLATDYVATPTGGRLCLGSVSYLWNTAKAITTNDPDLVHYGTASTDKLVHLTKVPDAAKLYCAKDATGRVQLANIQPADVSVATELLESGDHQLGINKFLLSTTAAATDTSTGETLYTFAYTIGSGAVSAMTADQSACLAPGVANADIQYCNVQQFSLVIRAGNRV